MISAQQKTDMALWMDITESCRNLGRYLGLYIPWKLGGPWRGRVEGNEGVPAGGPKALSPELTRDFLIHDRDACFCPRRRYRLSKADDNPAKKARPPKVAASPGCSSLVGGLPGARSVEGGG